jgi:phosphoinositide-3-kinase, regulatory subunit 4
MEWDCILQLHSPFSLLRSLIWVRCVHHIRRWTAFLFVSLSISPSIIYIDQCICLSVCFAWQVYIKQPSQQEQSMDEYHRWLQELRGNLNMVQNRNVMPFQKFIETEKACYLMRQYFANNLVDRIGTRPFLTSLEKAWVAFQLLMALRQAHFYGLCHGDVKSENVMVTSWNWVFLTDFAPYKPTFIPQDDSTHEFSYYFDTSERRVCYLAPERFVADSAEAAAAARWVHCLV